MSEKNAIYEGKVRRAIRDALALDPIVTQAQLHERITKQFKYPFDTRYIAKLRDKVIKEERMELDRTRIEQRMIEIKETHRLARERLLRIVYWSTDNALPGIKPPRAAEIAEAAKNLVMLDLAVFNAEISNGFYRRPIEDVAKQIHYTPLPDDVRMLVVAAWKRGSMLPAHTIEQMVPALPEHADIQRVTT